MALKCGQGCGVPVCGTIVAPPGLWPAIETDSVYRGGGNPVGARASVIIPKSKAIFQCTGQCVRILGLLGDRLLASRRVLVGGCYLAPARYKNTRSVVTVGNTVLSRPSGIIN